MVYSNFIADASSNRRRTAHFQAPRWHYARSNSFIQSLAHCLLVFLYAFSWRPASRRIWVERIRARPTSIAPHSIYIKRNTWIYNNTGRSIFATLLFHASLNLSTFKLFPVFESQSAVPYYSLLIFISVITILIIWGPKRMVREKPVKTTLSNGG